MTEYRHQILLGASATAIHTRQAGESPETTWVTNDHLGSGTLVMDESGATLLNLSFASFGERRGAAWHDEPTPGDWTAIESTTRRGFTWHEHLDSVNLIHMNGRVYDPWLGQFLSADPVDGNVYLSQRLNRYSYVMNSPHGYTDPSGFSPWCADDRTCLIRLSAQVDTVVYNSGTTSRSIPNITVIGVVGTWETPQLGWGA